MQAEFVQKYLSKEGDFMIWPFRGKKEPKQTRLEKIIEEFSEYPDVINAALMGEFNKTSYYFLEKESSKTANAIFDYFAASGFYDGMSSMLRFSYEKFNSMIAKVKEMDEPNLDMLATKLFGDTILTGDELIEFIKINPELFAKNKQVIGTLGNTYRRISAIRAASVLKDTDLLAQIFTYLREKAMCGDEYETRTFRDSVFDIKRYNKIYQLQCRLDTKDVKGRQALVEERKTLEQNLYNAIENRIPRDLQKEVFKRSVQIYLNPNRHNSEGYANFGLAVEYALKSEDQQTILKMHELAIACKQYNSAFEIAERMGLNDSLENFLKSQETYRVSRENSIKAAQITGRYDLLGERFIENFESDCQYEADRQNAKLVFDVLCDEKRELTVDKRDVVIMLNKMLEERPTKLKDIIATAELLIHSDDERRTYDLYFDGVEKAILENIRIGKKENIDNVYRGLTYARKYDVNFKRSPNMVKLHSSMEKGVLAA